MVRGQREKIQNDQKGEKSFDDEGRWECSISRGGPDCTVEVYWSEETKKGVAVLQVNTQQDG